MFNTASLIWYKNSILQGTNISHLGKRKICLERGYVASQQGICILVLPATSFLPKNHFLIFFPDFLSTHFKESPKLLASPFHQKTKSGPGQDTTCVKHVINDNHCGDAFQFWIRDDLHITFALQKWCGTSRNTLKCWRIMNDCPNQFCLTWLARIKKTLKYLTYN